MIYRKDIENAIAECEAEPLTAAKLEKLAHLYIVHGYLFGSPGTEAPKAAADHEKIMDIDGDSEFCRAACGKNAVEVWAIIADLVDTLEILHPRLYNGLIQKLNEI